MAKHIWSVLCNRGLLDTQTNQVSLIDVVEAVRIRGPRWPSESDEPVFVPTGLTLVTLWTRSDMAIPERMHGRLVVIAPDGQTFPGKTLDIDLHSAPRARAFMRLAGLPFKGPGEYQISVETRRSDDDAWDHNANVPVEVAFEEVLVPQPRAVSNKRKPKGQRQRAAKR